MFCTALVPGSSLHHAQDARRGSRGLRGLLGVVLGVVPASWHWHDRKPLAPTAGSRAGGAAEAAGRCCKRHIRRNGLGVSTTPALGNLSPTLLPNTWPGGWNGEKWGSDLWMSIPGMDPWCPGNAGSLGASLPGFRVVPGSGCSGGGCATSPETPQL